MKLLLIVIVQIVLIGSGIYIYSSLSAESEPERIRETITKSLIENRSFLIKRELFIESIIRKEEKGKLWGTDKKALIVAKGKVPYGIDFAEMNLTDLQINEAEKTVNLTLLEPSVYDVIVSNIYVYDVQTGVFSDEEEYLKKVYQSAYSDAKRTLAEQARLQLRSGEVDKQIRDEFVLFFGQLFGLQGINYTLNISFQKTEADSAASGAAEIN